MTINKADKEADIMFPQDRDEMPSQMEPLLLGVGSARRADLTELATQLAMASTGFSRSLRPAILRSLASLVRAMNCYYSNLIEGHATHPIEIERALKADFSLDPKKRNLQLEARAHITTQQWIDDGHLPGAPTSSAALLAIHDRFCRLLPDELLWVTNPDTGERSRVIPGELRKRDVIVGQHIAVSPGALPRFMDRFEQGYSKLGTIERILAAACAHHRLLWIHPFLDGNGRVARLMSHAILLEAAQTGGIWSAARGLARQVTTYKDLLAACDEQRHGNYDGRGNLSESRLADFVEFFLTTCIDQINFMEDLIQPDRLRHRIMIWAEEEIRVGALPSGAGAVLTAVLHRGELPRADVVGVLGAGERQSRRITSALIKAGALSSASSRAPLHLAFPATLASRWLPGLFPDPLRG